MRRLPALLLLLVAAFAIAAPAAATQTVSVCIDPEPPPWTYWKRDKDGKATREPAGFSVELVRRVFHSLGRDVHFVTEVPWSRCIHDVRTRHSGFGMDIYKDGPHVEQYLFSVPYNTLTPQLFTLRDHPIEVESVDDLKRYKGCGIVGGAYDHYGLKDEDLDLSANGYPGVIQKLKGHHCDYFVEELEVLAGYRLMHEDYINDPDIAHRPLKGAQRPSLHLVTAPDGPDAALMPRINSAIESMDKSGEIAAMWRKYTGDIPYNR